MNTNELNQLYDPKSSGIVILPKVLSNQQLLSIQNFLVEKQELFEVKREKIIQNNQKVFLLYRGGFGFDYFKGTVFEDVMAHYLKLRDEVNQCSSIPFMKGHSVEIKLIHYPISDLGVDIHKDLSSNVNMIVFYNLLGSAEVQTYANKAGESPRSHLVEAGDASVMRAPRSPQEPDIRPYHAVKEVRMERTVIVIREINEELEELTNKDNWRGF